MCGGGDDHGVYTFTFIYEQHFQLAMHQLLQRTTLVAADCDSVVFASKEQFPVVLLSKMQFGLIYSSISATVALRKALWLKRESCQATMLHDDLFCISCQLANRASFTCWFLS